MKYLRPIIDKKKYTNLMQKAILAFLRKNFYDKIAEVVKPIETYYNDNSIIIEAIRKNQIQYVDGKFYGKFNARLSKALTELGAKWNKRTKTFDILREKLPMDIIGAIGAASVYTMTLQKALLDVLSTLNIETAMPELKEILDTPLDYVLEDLDEQTQTTFKKAISITPKLSEFERETIKREYTESVELSIKKFTQEQTQKLREMVEYNAFYGNKNQSLVKMIQKEFKTTINKAKFLARNETSIFVAKYRKAQYLSAGITKVKWSTSHDNRVRQEHKELDGKIFNFTDADAPIIDERTGQRGWAGMAYGCRCTISAVID